MTITMSLTGRRSDRRCIKHRAHKKAPDHHSPGLSRFNSWRTRRDSNSQSNLLISIAKNIVSDLRDTVWDTWVRLHMLQFRRGRRTVDQALGLDQSFSPR